jgi:hypothetical protein
MSHTLTALLSAGAICAFAWASPALAQTGGDHGYGDGPWPYGPDSTFAGGYPTIASRTGTPAYSWDNTGPWAATGGQCDIIAGNRVCTAAPANGFAPLMP